MVRLSNRISGCLSKKSIQYIQDHGIKVLIIRYEEIDENFGNLFQLIEDHFSLQIVPGDREKIQSTYCKENVEKNIQPLMNFDKFFPISGFHGGHIQPQGYIPRSDVAFELEKNVQTRH